MSVHVAMIRAKCTYTICDEQDRHRKQVIVVLHTKLGFHPVQSGVTDGDSVHETHQVHPYLSTIPKSAYDQECADHGLGWSVVSLRFTIIGTILRSNFRISLCSSTSSTILVGVTISSAFSSPDRSVGDEVPDSIAIGDGCSASLRKKPMAV
jgi:hypothetical protein